VAFATFVVHPDRVPPSGCLTVARGGGQAPRMSSAAPVPPRKLPIVKLAIGAVLLLVVAVLVMRGLDLRDLVDRGLAVIRGAGPGLFFTALALLPAAGLPLMAFTIPAGEAFAPTMGLWGVIVAVMAAVAVNLSLIYWLARYALRPVLTGLLKRYGYGVPAVTPATSLTVTLLVRLTPGPPYTVQGYLLGLAEVPFRQYLVVSWLCTLPWAVGAVVLGRGVLNGNFKTVVAGIGVIVVAVVAVHFLRQRFLKREG